MNRQGRSQLALGAALILFGAWFLLDKTMPAFHDFAGQYTDFPYNLMWIGAAILLFGLFIGQPDMAVPACIVAGIGVIFFIQDNFIDEGYSSWKYMWTLIPGFIGIGTVLTGLLGRHTAHNVRRGLNTMVVSAVLFLVFASIFGGLSLLGQNYIPAIVLILLGVWLLGSGFYRSLRKKDDIGGSNAP
jgi:hypothetical protein